MNFLTMEYFIAVAREKSITKAAVQLHITQQTLSAHIAMVEKELGCKLLLRHVPLELTYSGQVFLQYALDIHQKYQDMKQEFCDISGNQKGVLKIGVTFARGRALMPPLIEEFQREYPYIEIRIIEASNELLQRHLISGDVDIAIANFPESLPGIELTPYYWEEIVLLISDFLLKQLYSTKAEEILQELASGKLSLLSNCPFVLGIPDDIGGNVGRQILRRENLRPPIKAQSENIDTLLSLCVRGVGACFCPENLIKPALTEEELSRLHIIRISQEEKYQIRFGALKKNYQWSVISDFIKSAMEVPLKS